MENWIDTDYDYDVHCKHDGLSMKKVAISSGRYWIDGNLIYFLEWICPNGHKNFMEWEFVTQENMGIVNEIIENPGFFRQRSLRKRSQNGFLTDILK